LFLCSRCRAQVLLCSHCDRGQHYCGRECSGAARRERRREAAQRYQQSRRGRLAHAARSRRWRERQAARADAAVEVSSPNIVTHQGCPAPAAAAPLTACASTTVIPAAEVLASATGVPLPWQCRHCRRPLLPHVRQDYLRRRHGRDRLP
jgi:hypothetical protein